MTFVNTPIQFINNELSVSFKREIDDVTLMLDNLVELIVFTPKGSFSADPDFGFEYWNHEYSNIHYRDFNNNYTGMGGYGLYNDVTRKECQESIKKSLETYEPQLKHIDVFIELNSIDENKQNSSKKVFSKYEVSVRVMGVIDDGLGMVKEYEKRVTFFMEPTVKKITI
ncbi:MAG: hypothetical protein IIV53_05280 [Bacteroidaceae bacterium]|nr:hypothetical protein [Bacteroidaceae bacterium]